MSVSVNTISEQYKSDGFTKAVNAVTCSCFVPVPDSLSLLSMENECMCVLSMEDKPWSEGTSSDQGPDVQYRLSDG